MSTFEFKAELAPTARAKCKACKVALPKDQARMGVRVVVDSAKAADMDDRQRALIESMNWYHPSMDCLGQFRKTAKWWIDNAPTRDSIVGLEDLDEEDQDAIGLLVDELKEGKSGAKPKAKAKGKAKAKAKKGSSSAGGKGRSGGSSEERSSEEEEEGRQGRKRGRAKDYSEGEGSEDDEGEHTPKKRKTPTGGDAAEDDDGGGSDDEAIEVAAEKLSKKTLTQLKEMLRLNQQLLSGRKDELVTRVAEGQVLGALPKCPECEAGTLKWNSQAETYSCPGFFNDGQFAKCAWKGGKDEVERNPWKSA